MRHLHPAFWLASFILAVCVGWHVVVADALHTRQAVPPPQVPARGTPQSPQPTFRVQIDLVQVDVIATGADGRFANDLKQGDFELLEDGKPQQIATFQLVDVPIRGNAEAAATFALSPPDVRSNAAGMTGRVYLIVLDDIRTPFDKSMFGRTVATRFVQQYMEPGDTGAVVFTSGRRDVSQEFTSDRRLLQASIDKFAGRVGDPELEPALAASDEHGIRGVVSTLAALAQSLGARTAGGRKACVYIGPGFPAVQPGGTRPINAGEYRDLAAAANRANVTFYTMDPAGLSTVADAASASSAQLDAVAVQNAVEAAHEGLQWLAVDTGGFAVPNSNNFDRPFERIRRETSSYYLLGYYPTQQKEGSNHTIAVRLRKPGITVRARAGYTVPKASARSSVALRAKNVPAVLLPALDTPLPAIGIRFSAAAAVFNGAPGSPRWASVVIEIDGRDLDTSGKGGAEVGIIALDKSDAVKGHDVRHVDLALDPAGLARVQQAGLRVQARVPLDGDVKALRIAIADSGTPRVGSLSVDVAISDFNNDAVSMSGVLLTDARALQVPTTNADEELRKMLGGPVSTRREFQSAEPIGWAAEIYEKAGATRDVRVTTVIEGSDKRLAFRREERHPPSEPRNARGGIQVTGQAGLTDVPPGSYVLRIEALVAGARQPITREVSFRVRN